MPDPVVPVVDAELRALVERALGSQYELEREIGRGGMGIVYLARDRRLKRPVAIKVLPPELAFRSEIRTRFLREAETAAQLSHPNIVPIHAVDERDGLVYFVMAYVDGGNLALRLHELGALPFDEVRRCLLEVARALAFAHERGVVHRDIKPDNILLNREDGRVMVTDFGIARAITDGADARLTATGIAIGTPAYMSPEQSTGEREVDGRSDLYALGVVGYQMLAGALPFSAANTPALLVKHVSEAPVPVQQRRAGIPADLARAVMLLLEKHPDDRFPSAAALAVALESGELPVPAPARASATRPLARAAVEAAPPPGAPTGEELARWNALPVATFRKQLAPWVIVGGVSAIVAMVGGPSFVGVWGLYSIYMAWKYAKLWTEGFDWRDVLKEPQDRLLQDVVEEWGESVQALWNPVMRERVRARAAARDARGIALFRRAGVTPPAMSAIPAPAGALPSGALVDATRDRDAILRLVEALPKRDRALVRDVPATALALYAQVEALDAAVRDLERAVPAESPAAIDAEIARLEAEANPLDVARSDERVRRLAHLRRQRRAAADSGGRLGRRREALATALAALATLRLEVARVVGAPGPSPSLTAVAERALAIGREVDAVVAARDDVERLAPGPRG